MFRLSYKIRSTIVSKNRKKLMKSTNRTNMYRYATLEDCKNQTFYVKSVEFCIIMKSVYFLREYI